MVIKWAVWMINCMMTLESSNYLEQHHSSPCLNLWKDVNVFWRNQRSDSLFQFQFHNSSISNVNVKLFEVLEKKDLSKAGDLFSLEDSVIVNELSKVLKTIEVGTL